MSKYEKAPLYLVKLDNGNLCLADSEGRVVSCVTDLTLFHTEDGIGATLALTMESGGFDVGLPPGVSLAVKVAEGSPAVRPGGDVPAPTYKFGGGDDA